MVSLFSAWTQRGFQRRLIEIATGSSEDRAMNAVFALHRYGPQSPAWLANLLGMSRSNVSKLVNQLVERGLAERHDDPADARSVQVRLTPSGEVAGEAQVAVTSRMARHLLESWEPEAVERFAVDLAAFTTRAVAFASLAQDGFDPFSPAPQTRPRVSSPDAHPTADPRQTPPSR